MSGESWLATSSGSQDQAFGAFYLYLFLPFYFLFPKLLSSGVWLGAAWFEATLIFDKLLKLYNMSMEALLSPFLNPFKLCAVTG